MPENNEKHIAYEQSMQLMTDGLKEIKNQPGRELIIDNLPRYVIKWIAELHGATGTVYMETHEIATFVKGKLNANHRS